MTPINELKNMGPKITEWLIDIGIETEADLERVGVINVYKMLKAKQPRHVNLNALWSLQGALLGIPWDKLPVDMKDSIRKQLGDKS